MIPNSLDCNDKRSTGPGNHHVASQQERERQGRGTGRGETIVRAVAFPESAREREAESVGMVSYSVAAYGSCWVGAASVRSEHPPNVAVVWLMLVISTCRLSNGPL